VIQLKYPQKEVVRIFLRNMENNDNGSKHRRIAMFSMNSDPLAPIGTQENGGKEIYIRSLSSELSKMGWAIDVYTRLDNGHKKQIAFVGKNIRIIRLRGGPVKYIPNTEFLPLIPEIFQNFLEFNHNVNPYVLFHSHRWDGGIVALMAKEKFKTPLAHTFHTLGVQIIEIRKKYLKEEDKQDYLSERLNIESKIIKKADRIIALSNLEKESLEKIYGCPVSKITVIPAGVNLKQWKIIDKNKAREYLMVKPEEFVVLFVGRFEWSKGIGTLIHAAELLKPEIPNLKIVIVGGKIFGRVKNKEDFKEYERVNNIVTQKKLGETVNFIGNIENKSLSNYYRSANIVVVPSYRESFGLVILEGMANMIPVVASNVSGPASIISHNKNGLLFEPRNPLELKNKIIELYKSSDLANRLSEQGYKDVFENYSWQNIAKLISQEYDNIIKKA